MRTVVREQVGTRGADRVIQQTFGDLRLCMRAEDVEGDDRAARPSGWPGRASRVVLEARRGEMVQRLEIQRQPAGGPRTSWQVRAIAEAFRLRASPSPRGRASA